MLLNKLIKNLTKNYFKKIIIMSGLLTTTKWIFIFKNFLDHFFAK